MTRAFDLTGQHFGRLIVLRQAGRAKSGSVLWQCCCRCGAEPVVQAHHLRSGHTRSCGCLSVDTATKHGHRRRSSDGKRSPTYQSWKSMIERCYLTTKDSYPNYGGRGVRVCDRWNPAAGGSFENFLKDMGPRPDGTTLDKDRRGGVGGLLYSPETCAWEPPGVQRRHSAQNRYVTHNGRTLCVSDWAAAAPVELTAAALCQRLTRGWTMQRALETPMRVSRAVSPEGL